MEPSINPHMNLESFNTFVSDCCDQAAAILDQYYFQDDLDIKSKEDESPVTIADRKVEQMLREKITQAFPDHGIIGEEYGNDHADREWTWVLDPIDGTKSFITGAPMFTTLIGLLHNGEPSFGAIFQPTLRQLCIGDNQTCLFNGKPVHCRDRDSIESATVLASAVDQLHHQDKPRNFYTLMNRAGIFRTWGDGYGYLLLATGKADVMLDPIVNPWDILPVLPVIRGAGLKVSNWLGQNGPWTSCIASVPGIADEIITQLNS